MPSRGQKDLDQYIFSRPEMARLLGISTNALRCRMRKGKCDLEYRFDGRNFLFKRPSAIKDPGPPKTTKEDSHEKTLRQYDRKVQKRVNRGATHGNHGGEPVRKGKYTQQSFKYHNEMKILNSLQGKYQNDAQKREFEAMNEEALKEADKRAKEKAEKSLGDYNNRPKYGGMVYGSWPHNGIAHMILIVLAVQIVPFILQADLTMNLEPRKKRRKKLLTIGTNLK